MSVSWHKSVYKTPERPEMQNEITWFIAKSLLSFQIDSCLDFSSVCVCRIIAVRFRYWPTDISNGILDITTFWIFEFTFNMQCYKCQVEFFSANTAINVHFQLNELHEVHDMIILKNNYSCRLSWRRNKLIVVGGHERWATSVNVRTSFVSFG